MHTGIYWDRLTGKIEKVVRASERADLLANVSYQGQALTEVPPGHPVETGMVRWRVNPATGAVEEKVLVAATVDKVLVAADGTDEAVVTFRGLLKPAVVHGVLIDPSDPALAVTSDVPARFDIQLVDDEHWSNPVQIEAR